MTRTASTAAFATIALALGLLAPPNADAGCGCSKPAPELAQVRPHATYAGTDVSVFHSSIQVGGLYTVKFVSGTTTSTAEVAATAVSRRDLADGQLKAQVVVPLPALPLGPTAIEVTASGEGSPLLTVDDAGFTVVPAPIAVPESAGTISLGDQQAAVTRDGTVYFSLDLTGVSHARIFEAQLLGYPLRFTFEDVVFYNSQGFLMQRVDESMPGLLTIAAPASGADSDVLRYSRHEFSTFFLQHDERQAHAVDPSDPNWHLDGTPHIDHDHLIVAILGWIDGGSVPAAGATPVFDLNLGVTSLFDHGVVGIDEVKMERRGRTDSYDSSDGSTGSRGDVFSNHLVEVDRQAVVDGDVTADKIQLGRGSTVTGAQNALDQPVPFLPVTIPEGLDPLGAVVLGDSQVLTLERGSYEASSLVVEAGGTLVVDNSAGPVTVYVSQQFKVIGEVVVMDPRPENFAVYVASGGVVKLEGNGSLTGVVYAPDANVQVMDASEFSGALVGSSVTVKKNARVHYDTALRSAQSGS